MSHAEVRRFYSTLFRPPDWLHNGAEFELDERYILQLLTVTLALASTPVFAVEDEGHDLPWTAQWIGRPRRATTPGLGFRKTVTWPRRPLRFGASGRGFQVLALDQRQLR